MKKSLFLVSFCALLIWTPFFFREKVEGFRLGKLIVDFPLNPEWDFKLDANEIQQVQEILNQNFNYLSRGKQSFVFASEDGQFIIKLFQNDSWIHPWCKFIRSHILKGKDKIFGFERLVLTLSSAKVAYEQAADLTGLVYVHLSETTNARLPTSQFKDQIGRVFHLDLNRYSFVIQHRGIEVKEAFLKAIRAGDHEKFKQMTLSLYSLLNKRTARGLKNGDGQLFKNFGFLGDQAIEWDFGHYHLDPSMVEPKRRQAEINRFLLKMKPLFKQTPKEWFVEYKALLCQIKVLPLESEIADLDFTEL